MDQISKSLRYLSLVILCVGMTVSCLHYNSESAGIGATIIFVLILFRTIFAGH